MGYTFDSKIPESEKVSSGVVLDFNKSNEVVDMEMRDLSIRSASLTFAPCNSRWPGLCDGTPVCTCYGQTGDAAA